MLDLLSPRKVRDVDEAVNTFFEFYKYTEVGEVANLCVVLRTYRIFNFDVLPRIFLELLDADTAPWIREEEMVEMEEDSNQ